MEGERFQPMVVVLDRIQGANAWLTVGLREGKNREIRRAMNAINLTVNRLIRVSYGPFRLNDMVPGQVEEIRGKVLREQLGEGPTPVDDARPKPTRAPRAQAGLSKPAAAKPAAKPGPRPAPAPGARPRVITSSRAKPGPRPNAGNKPRSFPIPPLA